MALLSGDPVDVGVLDEKLGATGGGVPQELVAELSVVGDDVELADEGCKEVRGIVDEVVTGDALDESEMFNLREIEAVEGISEEEVKGVLEPRSETFGMEMGVHDTWKSEVLLFFSRDFLLSLKTSTFLSRDWTCFCNFVFSALNLVEFLFMV